MRRVLGPIGVLSILMLCTGCGPRAQTVSSTAAPSRPRSTAVLAILSPEPGAVIHGPTLRVRLSLRDAEVVPQTSAHLRPDKGHVHLSIDGKVISMLYGLDQIVDVAPGAHVLTTEFVAQDHFPFQPRVVKTLTFTVK